MRRVNWDDQMRELEAAGAQSRWTVGWRRRLGDAVVGV